MNGITFPGKTISCEGADRCGETTETEGTAICAVSARTVFCSPIRLRMPYTRIPPKTTSSAPAKTQPRFDRNDLFIELSHGDSWGGGLICVCDCIGITIPVPSNISLTLVSRSQFYDAYCG